MNPDKGMGNLFSWICEAFGTQGVEGFRPVIERLLNEVMRAERTEALQAGPWERTESRLGHANGFKSRVLQSRIGPLRVEIPQVRGLSFYPKSLERGCRSEVALKLAVAEMYVMGVSTRKVTEITEQLCGFEVSSGQVSRISKGLDDELGKFRNRPLGEYPYILLDARYEKVRHGGVVRDLACLIATGVAWSGRREILGVSVSLSEAEVHWKEFLKSLQGRGLSGIELIISDDHSGLRAARTAIFPSVKWQRCQFHLIQNALAYAPSLPIRAEIVEAMRDIFNARSKADAEAIVRSVAAIFEKKAPEFVSWLEENIAEGLTVFDFPRGHRRKLRTTNMLERQNREIRRRTRVASIFPNSESCLRLVSAVLQEVHEEWSAEKRYLNMELLRELRQENPIQRNYRKKVA